MATPEQPDQGFENLEKIRSFLTDLGGFRDYFEREVLAYMALTKKGLEVGEDVAAYFALAGTGLIQARRTLNQDRIVKHQIMETDMAIFAREMIQNETNRLNKTEEELESLRSSVEKR